MSERLYYRDPYLSAFEATVVRSADADGRRGVVLDRTAFYPTSGGQPFDTGALGPARVIDVVEQDDGTIVHVVEGDLATGPVSGRIDWGRRFDHMQQHTGQHVLSAAFDRLFGVRTMSFHLGAVSATIDLARAVSGSEISQAEDLANQVVWEDRGVAIRFVDAEAAASLPLRKESARTGELRIIEVEGFDVSACGGTHVRRTGAIGIIVVSSWEKFRGGSRVEFRCGGRALRAYRVLRDSVAAATRLMSTGAEELPQGIERLQADNRDTRRLARDLQSRLARFEADSLAAAAEEVGRIKVVLQAPADYDINGLKILAQAVAERGGHAAVLCTSAPPLGLVIARASDVAIDASALVRQLTATFGGKGGGRPELAQGGGLDAAPRDVLEAARAALS
jgi:alanyl-tRNA synthetase